MLSSTTFSLANSRYKRNAVQQHGVFLVSVFAEGLVDRLLVCLGTEEDDEVEDHVDDEELRQHGLHEGEASTVPAEDAGHGDRDEGQREVDGGGAGERQAVVIHDRGVDADEEGCDEPYDELCHGGPGGSREEQGQGGDDGADAGADQTEIEKMEKGFHGVISLRIL